MYDLLNYLINIRKYIHKNAEPSLKEFKTQQILLDVLLNKFNISKNNISVCGETGILLFLEGENKNSNIKKNIMFRAEMDALPIKEDNDLYYKSLSNYSHMCGHDGHMCILLHTIFNTKHLLKDIPYQSKIYFLFQPGEEGHLGSVKCINDNCLKDIDEIYALHNSVISVPKNIYIKEKAILSACKKFEIIIISNNNSEKINNVRLATLLKIKLQLYNYINDNNDVLLSFPKITNEDNYCAMKGVLRGFDKEIFYKTEQIINAIVIEEVNNNKEYKIDFKINITELSRSPVYNDPVLTESIIQLFKDKFPTHLNITDKGSYFSDDFSYYQEKVKGVYFYIDCGFSEGKYLHTSRYIFNDDLIEFGSKILNEIIKNRFNIIS